MISPQSISRRGVLQQMVGAVAASAVGSQAACLAAEDPPLAILDTHQHLWDLEKFTLPWLSRNAHLRRSYVMADYLAATQGLNVVKAVYMEVDVEPSQQQAEADHLIALCKEGRHPTKAAVISGRPASETFAAYIKPLAASPDIKGVRQVLHGESTPAGYCLQDAFVRGVRLLGELGLRYDLCVRSAELSDCIKLVDQCPDTRFVLDHCGNIDPKFFAQDASEEQVHRRDTWKRDIAALAQRKNVVCKISGIVASATPGKWQADDLAPAINHCLDSFGPQRVMFGSDWPVCTLAATLAQWVAALKQIVASRPLPQQRALFHDNAARFYELS